MNFRRLYPLLIIFAAFNSTCSKDSTGQDDAFLPAGTFVATSEIRQLPAELFVQTGKITDAAKIADFIRRKQIGDVLTAITDVSKLRLVVKEDGSAELSGILTGETLKGNLSQYNEHLLLLTARDSVERLTPADSAPTAGYYGNGIAISAQCAQPASVFTIYSKSRCTSLAYPSGYSQRCTFLPVTALEYENKQTLNIPALTYRGFRGSGNQQCYTGFSYAPGLLNSDFYKDLGPTDSVIVAKKQIILSLALPQ